MPSFRKNQRRSPWLALLGGLVLHFFTLSPVDAETPTLNDATVSPTSHAATPPPSPPISQTGMLVAGLALFAFASLSRSTRLSSAWTRWAQAQRVTAPPAGQAAQFSIDAPRFG
jgi:hypothetical protein